MKKLMAVLLSALMVISCFSPAVYAAEETLVADTQRFSDKLNEYILSLGLGEYYFDVDTTADGYVEGDPATYTYTNLFTPENIRTSEKIKIYKEYRSEIYFQIVGIEEKYTTEKIGDYTFTSDTFFHADNPCGYFAGYFFSEDYGSFRGIASEAEGYWPYLEDYASIFPCINEKPEDIRLAEALLEEKYGTVRFNLTYIGSIGNCKIYNNRASEVMNMYYNLYFGDYIFEVYSQQIPDDLGVFVIHNNKAYNLREAYDQGVLTDMDAFYDIYVSKGDRYFTFNVEKSEKPLSMLIEYLTTNNVYVNSTYGDNIDYYNLGTAGKYTVVYGGKWNGYGQETSALGDYIFNTIRSFELNKKGFWIADDENIYPLDQAYTDGIVSETEVNEICELLSTKTKYSFTVEKSATDAETVFKAKFGEGNYSLAQIADFDEYGVYYNVPAGVTFLSYTKQIGDYEFDVFSQQTPYDIGLYVISDTEAYTLEDAWNGGYISPENMLAMYKAIKASSLDFSFSVKRFQFTDGTGTIQPQPTDPIPTEPVVPTLEISKNTIEAGEKIQLTVNNAEDKNIAFKSLNPKIAIVDENGVVTGLKKGKAELAVKAGDETLTCTVKVKNNPKLVNVKNGKKVTIVKVKKKKTVKVKIQGKAKDIKNVYTNKKIAKIKSKPNATTLKVKGLKKGATILKIRVNGVKTLKLVVVVK